MISKSCINPSLGTYICAEVIILEERSTISYDENWQSVSVPETPPVVSHTEEEEEEPLRRTGNPPRHLLLTLQLTACVLLAAAALILKGIGGEVYEKTHAWYTEQLNATVLFDGSRGVEGLFSATADEAAS